MYINRAHGWRGPNNDYRNVSSATANGGCDRIVNKPYIRVYGNDVSAGGGFAGINCGAGTAGIKAFSNTHGGSGVQFAAYALGQMSGFVTASTRTSAPTTPRGLSFSNVAPYIGGVEGGDSTRPRTGGNFGGDGDCAPNFYRDAAFPDGDTRRNDTSATALSASSLGNGEQTHVNISGSRLTLTGGNNFNSRHAVFVDGDVFITGDIRYNNSDNPSWTNTDQIPNFALIAKGNIYISRNVAHLAGLFVAQPRDDGSKGKIYTCVNSSGPNRGAPVVISQIYDQCGGATNNRQLKIYGSFVANDVHFMRTYKSLRDSATREKYSDTNAAEVFIFSPEVYLAEPIFKPSSSAAGGTYDYITTLPPIL
jgi:hypothetical protein